MAKIKDNWFQHDFNASDDIKFIMLKSNCTYTEGLAKTQFYWWIIENLHKHDGRISIENNYHTVLYLTHVPESEQETYIGYLNEIVDIGLLTIDGTDICSRRVLENIESITETSNLKSKCAKKRWEKEKQEAKEQSKKAVKKKIDTRELTEQEKNDIEKTLMRFNERLPANYKKTANQFGAWRVYMKKLICELGYSVNDINKAIKFVLDDTWWSENRPLTTISQLGQKSKSGKLRIDDFIFGYNKANNIKQVLQ